MEDFCTSVVSNVRVDSTSTEFLSTVPWETMWTAVRSLEEYDHSQQNALAAGRSTTALPRTYAILGKPMNLPNRLR